MNHWLISLFGAVAGISTVVMGVVMTYVLYRSKNAEVVKGEMEAWKAKAERLDKDHQADAKVLHDREVEIAELKARTDLSEIRKGQASIMELIAKQSAAILENQNRGMQVAHEITTALRENQAAMVQFAVVMEKMERRLDQGLIMR